MSAKFELVFVPCPVLGHLVSMVEMAKLLVDRDDRLFVTVLIMKFPFDSETDSRVESLATSVPARIRFVFLPRRNPSARTSPLAFIHQFIESHKTDVREALAELSACGSPRLVGLVVDMFCTSMIDVTVQFGVPSYMFFTSGAAFLGIMLHLQSLKDEQHMDLTRLKGSDAELDFPCFAIPLPAAKFLPLEIFMEEEDCQIFLDDARRFRETKGILVNTFAELEPRAVEALAGLGAPTVYPVGPILSIKVESKKGSEVLDWLDQQPDASVVFLCFGSRGSFDEHQAKEIAGALEQSGYRFVWSLRRPSEKDKEAPCDYVDPAEVLPQGFLDRTARVGRVIGWAPQVAVLAHPAIGGFISHCGWNSTLESIWFGVPVAAWPQYAEQQFNAFQLVVDLGLAGEIKIDYRRDLAKGSDVVVTADEIAGGIRKLMKGDEAVERRKKVKEVSEKSRKALMEGGSSYLSLARFIQDVCSQ